MPLLDSVASSRLLMERSLVWCLREDPGDTLGGEIGAEDGADRLSAVS
jgi:hypothetical protein